MSSGVANGASAYDTRSEGVSRGNSLFPRQTLIRLAAA